MDNRHPNGDTGARPLSGLRVVEMGSLIAGPFCGQLLGDFGAEVVKLEDPKQGDPMRRWGIQRAGEGLWWPLIARNKKSVAIDLRSDDGRGIARQLIATADIVVENFRPGTLERWGMGYDELAADNPRVVLVRVSGYGQTGPGASWAGFGAIGEAFGGIRYLMGSPDRPPSRVAVSLGDSLAAVFATLGALLAIEERHRSGRGQVVDISIYESVLAIMESLLPDYALADYVRERSGSTLPGVVPSNTYTAIDGTWVVVAANADSVFRRLMAVLGREELADDPNFATHRARADKGAELDELIGGWVAARTADEAVNELREAGVPAGIMYRAPEMLADPHFAARRSIIHQRHERLGSYPMQGVFPVLARTPGGVETLGPALGEHTREIIVDELRLDENRFDDLCGRGILGSARASGIETATA